MGSASSPRPSASQSPSGDAVSFHHVLHGKSPAGHGGGGAAASTHSAKAKSHQATPESKASHSGTTRHGKAAGHGKTDHSRSKAHAVAVMSGVHIAARAHAVSSGKHPAVKPVSLATAVKVSGRMTKSALATGKAPSGASRPAAPPKGHETSSKPVMQVTVQGAPKKTAGSQTSTTAPKVQSASVHTGHPHRDAVRATLHQPQAATQASQSHGAGQATTTSGAGQAKPADAASTVKGNASAGSNTAPNGGTSVPSSPSPSRPMATAPTSAAGHHAAAAVHAPAGTDNSANQPQGWKIQPVHVQNTDGVRQSTWTIRPPVANGPPMTMELTQQGSNLKANLTVNAATAALITTAPTALPHHAVHLPDGVSTLQFTVMTQGGGGGGSGFGGQPNPQQPSPGQLAGTYGGHAGGGGVHAHVTSRSDAAAELMLSGVDYRA